MFEKEIKFIYDFNTNKIKSLGNFTTFTELQKIGLHPSILRFISADIDYLIFEDRQKLLKNSAFDYSGEKINKLFSMINDEIKKSKKLSADYVNKLILHAVTFNMNFLVRPKWALEKFVFEDSPSKSTLEIKQILNYLHFYSYLKKIIDSYLSKKKLLSINQNDFNELLSNIDKITMETSLPSVINEAVNSIKEFFSIGSIGTELINLASLKIFLTEKGLSEQLLILQNNYGSDDKIKINAKEVLSLLLSNASTETIFSNTELNIDETESIDEEEGNPSAEYTFEEDESANFEILEKEETFLTSFEEQPIKNIEEIDELIEEDSHGSGFTKEKDYDKDDLTHDELLLHNMKDENPKTLLPEDHYEDDNIEEIKEKNNLTYNDDVFNEHDFKSEDPSEIVDGENDFKDLAHFDLLTEESEIENDASVEKSTQSKKDFTIQKLEETQKDELIFELKDSSILDDVFEEEVQDEKNNVIELDEEKTKNDTDEFLDDQIKDDELLNEFDVEEKKELKTENEENPFLFSEDEFVDDKNDQIDKTNEHEDANEEETYYDETRTAKEQASGKRMIEMSDILEDKNMTRIIEVVFDYDMEDFANTIENISECTDKESALAVLDKMFNYNRISPNNKEAEILKEIISKYFDER